MNYRTNEDKISYPDYNYNEIISVDDLTEESGPVSEPVTLQEVKAYLRLEGFNAVVSGLSIQTPVSAVLTGGSATLSIPQLIGGTILSLSRDGTQYTQGDTPANQVFTFDPVTGLITFNNIGNVDGEPIGVSFGYPLGGGTAEEFDFDDDLISDLIQEGRMWVEKFTNITLIPKTLQVTFTNGLGGLELPGPVNGAMVFNNGDTVLTGEFLGTSFPRLRAPLGLELTVKYAAGYNAGNCPPWAKGAIKAYVADHYEYRGDDAPPAANKRAAQKCRPYRRVQTWA